MSLINSNWLFLAHSRYPIKSKLRCFISLSRSCGAEDAQKCLGPGSWGHVQILDAAFAADIMSPLLTPTPWPSPPLCSEDLRCPWQLGTVLTARVASQLRPWDLCLYRIKRTHLEYPRLSWCPETSRPGSITWCRNVQSLASLPPQTPQVILWFFIVSFLPALHLARSVLLFKS